MEVAVPARGADCIMIIAKRVTPIRLVAVPARGADCINTVIQVCQEFLMLPSPRGVRIASSNAMDTRCVILHVAVPARGADCILAVPVEKTIEKLVAVPARGADCILFSSA